MRKTRLVVPTKHTDAAGYMLGHGRTVLTQEFQKECVHQPAKMVFLSVSFLQNWLFNISVSFFKSPAKSANAHR